MNHFAARAADLVIAVATAFVILAVTIPLFLNPLWVSFEQGRAEAAAWTGFSETDLRAATGSILSDLVIGPPDFGVTVGGTPVLDEKERQHMRDVRGVFVGFFAVALVLGVAALVIAARRRGAAARAASWRAVWGGAVGLIATLVVAGLVSFVAFDTLFEVFHEIFFAGGSYTFDPATERLVQLFPFAFWQETAIVLGIVAILLALLVAWVADAKAGDDELDEATATAPATGGGATVR